jgi:hypothetical protein
MKSMTYGVMPAFGEFEAAFEREVEAEGYPAFRFGNCSRVGTCEMRVVGLWDELEKALAEFEAGDDEAGDWCSCVLGCLGFEWI